MKIIYLITEKTSGHISNMIAIADDLIKEGFKPIFILSGYKHELNIFKPLNYKYFVFNFSMCKLNHIFNLTKPIHIISSGARFSYKIIVLAKSKNIPTTLIEPNYYPGLANVLMSPGSHLLSPHTKYQKLYY